MLLGARQFFEKRGGGGWQNPYVTDGLIAMWDAEWNAGPGVHDGRPRLVNLCGGAPIVLSESAIIGANSVSYTSQSGATGSTIESYEYGGIATDVSPLPEAGDAITTECVASLPNTGAWANAAIAYAYRNGIRVSNNYQQGTVAGTFYSGRLYSISKQGPGDMLSRMAATSCRPLAWNSAEIYYNGVEVTATWNYTGARTDANVSILGTNYVGAQMSFGCMRIYNKCLTTDEVAANYAIDKARFNLT